MLMNLFDTFDVKSNFRIRLELAGPCFNVEFKFWLKAVQ